MATPSAKAFSIDTKDSCFMCLKFDTGSSTASVTPYHFQRLSNYLKLDFQNVYNISIQTTAVVSVLEGTEIEVSLCSQCSVEANKFVKLHKDLELIRKRVNTCVGRIHQVMVDADKQPSRLREYRERVTTTASPLDLIQASIAESLRKETIKKSSNISTTPADLRLGAGSTVTTINSTSAPPTPPKSNFNSIQTTPTTVPVVTPPRRQNDVPLVSSTTTTPAAKQEQGNKILVVDLDESDEEDSSKTVEETESGLVIKSVTGSSGSTFAANSKPITLNNKLQYQNSYSFQQQQLSQTNFSSNLAPSASFSSLESFTTNFDLREFGISTNPNPAVVISEDETWKKYSDGNSHCKLCGKIFDKYNRLNMVTHERMHAGVKPVNCQYCDQTFSSLRNRRIHILNFHRVEIFSQYHYPAVSTKNFKKFIDEVLENKNFDSGSERPYGCSYCPKYYKHKIDMETHLMSVHVEELGTKLMEMQRVGNVNGDEDSTNEIMKRKENVCLKCGTNFQTSPLLMQHITSCHSNYNITSQQSSSTTYKSKEQPSKRKNYSYVIKYKCSICSETFERPEDLKEHKYAKHKLTATSSNSAVETGTTFKCQYCEKKFKFHYSQRVHMLTLHRYQVFSRYVPTGTTSDVIDNGIQIILEKSKISVGQSHECRYCHRDFTGSVATILQNHILVSHFQEVVNELKTAVEKVNMNTGPTQEKSVLEATQVAVHPSESSVNTVEMILPD